MAVRIVTDSTSDIPMEEAKKLGITVVPLTIYFGDDAYLDNVDMDNAGFYQRLGTTKELPRSSQPSPGHFAEAYTNLIKEGADGILSINLASSISGTYQSASTASNALPDDLPKVPVEVIDSKNISAGLASLVLHAAQEAREGKSLEEIRANTLDRRERTRLLAMLDTLEFVRRGGRIGSAAAVLGNMLSVKPIITLKEEGVSMVERPRTRIKALERITQILKDGPELEEVNIAESNEQVGKQLEEALKKYFDLPMVHYRLSPVIGVHTGPGAVAAFFTTKKS